MYVRVGTLETDIRWIRSKELGSIPFPNIPFGKLNVAISISEFFSRYALQTFCHSSQVVNGGSLENYFCFNGTQVQILPMAFPSGNYLRLASIVACACNHPFYGYFMSREICVSSLIELSIFQHTHWMRKYYMI